ncbi:alpha/beta-hydrolase [Amylostereum chailletii]|nr:alpha/beta-hydrolase [Amylostereum chailletii]
MKMDPIFVVYKRVQGLNLAMDIYPPVRTDDTKGTGYPAIIYFHGGGMTAGDRNTLFPTWFFKRLTADGIAFITVDYRLITPSTGHDVVEDIRDLFTFLSDSLNSELAFREKEPSFQIDPSRLAVVGTSAGGLCCYLAAIHARPKPTAVVSIYGLGGEFFTPHFYTPKFAPFFMGRDLVDPAICHAYLYPQCATLPPLSASPFHPDNPEIPTHPRILLPRLYLQLGVYLDYWTGVHGLSERVGRLLPPPGEPVSEETRAAMRDAIPEDARVLFPQLWVTKDWPRTLLVHGEMDTVVHANDSQHLYQLLLNEGVDVRFEVVKGEEHVFDYVPGAEEKFGALFDRVQGFLREALLDGK